MNLALLILIISELFLMGICLLLRRRFKYRVNDLCSIIILSLILALCFEFIYWAFYNQLGFPPGENLTNADWLSFLSGYLGFAGALIMAWLVYKQDKKINELTMQEYQVIFKPVVRGLEMKTYSEDDKSHVFYRLENQVELYAKHDIKLIEETDENASANSLSLLPVFYFSLANMGKLKVNKLCFESVKIISPETGKVDYAFSFCKSNGGNILNGSHSVLPNSSLCICLVLHSLPQEINISRFELSFHYFIGLHKEAQNATFLIERNSQGNFFVADGENECHL